MDEQSTQRLIRLEEKVDDIMTNHLPTLDKKIWKLAQRVHWSLWLSGAILAALITLAVRA